MRRISDKIKILILFISCEQYKMLSLQKHFVSVYLNFQIVLKYNKIYFLLITEIYWWINTLFWICFLLSFSLWLEHKSAIIPLRQTLSCALVFALLHEKPFSYIPVTTTTWFWSHLQVFFSWISSGHVQSVLCFFISNDILYGLQYSLVRPVDIHKQLWKMSAFFKSFIIML